MRERATMWHYHIESNLYPHCVHWHVIDVLNTLMLCYDSISHPLLQPQRIMVTILWGLRGRGGVRTLPSPHCTSQRTHTAGGRRFNFRGTGTEKRTCAIQTLSLREDLGVNCVVPLTKSKRCFFLPHTFPGRATRGLVEPLQELDYYYRPNYVPSPRTTAPMRNSQKSAVQFEMTKGETGKEGRNGRGLQPFITAGPRGKSRQGVHSPTAYNFTCS